MTTHQNGSSLPHVDEELFAHLVLHSSEPVIVVFVTSMCPASRALLPIMEDLKIEWGSGIQILLVDTLVEELLTEIQQVTATPTLIVFEAGEVITRVVGFVAEGLLRQLFVQIATKSLPREWFWRPTEDVFETAIILPLLKLWSWSYVRQAPCQVQEGRHKRGRIDFLIHIDDPALSLTLFENKRSIMSHFDLNKAAVQAHSYAHPLNLPSFVVAAPSGMWVYAAHHGQFGLIRSFSSLHVHIKPHEIHDLLFTFYKERNNGV